jgi:catechol 2,3-dioxygenase-like lactoylglutathione lyase family enzyme
MRVLRLAWLGVPTEEYDAMVGFFENVLGLRVEFRSSTSTELSAANDDRVQLFGPGDRYHDFFRRHSAGPVALFEVDDVHEAARELEAAGVELLGGPESDERWTWINFRAPDGHVYELASRSAGAA